jgi:hypothetical protein
MSRVKSMIGVIGLGLAGSCLALAQQNAPQTPPR